MEKKSIPLALFVWFPNTPSLSRKPSPHPYSQHSLKTKHCMHAVNRQLPLGQRKMTPESFLALSWPKRLQNNLQQSQNVSTNTVHNVGKTTVCPGQRSHRGKLTQITLGKKNTDSQPVREGNLHQTSGIRMENMLDTTLWKRE